MLFQLASWLLFLAVVRSDVPAEAEASPPADVSSVEVSSDGEQVDSKSKSEVCEETLGQKLIRRWTEKPGSGKHAAAASLPWAIHIENPNNEPYDYYWFDAGQKQSHYKGRVRPGGIKTTNSYVGHIFHCNKIAKDPQNEPGEEVFRLTVKDGKTMYVIPPTDVESPRYKELQAKEKFLDSYLEEHGYPWLAHYPRNPPVLPMWDASEVGYIHKVETNNTFWTCIPSDFSNAEEVAKCAPKEGESMTMTLEVVSSQPKAFVIENTISHAEADAIVQLATPKMRRSLAGTDGGMVSDTRTSSNAWLARTESPILETIYRRAADLLMLNHIIMDNNENCEHLQVVNYGLNQEYKNHHDFGADGRPHSRFITLLFYLNEQLHENAGGETGFPKANDGKGFAAHPGKGNSLMFYSLLEDGNGDDYSLHAGMPVLAGEKWMCNFWVWDPHR